MAIEYVLLTLPSEGTPAKLVAISDIDRLDAGTDHVGLTRVGFKGGVFFFVRETIQEIMDRLNEKR